MASYSLNVNFSVKLLGTIDRNLLDQFQFFFDKVVRYDHNLIYVFETKSLIIKRSFTPHPNARCNFESNNRTIRKAIYKIYIYQLYTVYTYRRISRYLSICIIHWIR